MAKQTVSLHDQATGEYRGDQVKSGSCSDRRIARNDTVVGRGVVDDVCAVVVGDSVVTVRRSRANGIG